jgi:hypothetical protein
MSIICEFLNGGVAKTCDTNVGGIKKMYITEKENVSSLALSSPGNEISTITMAALTQFYEFEFTRNTCSYTENYVQDPATGNEFFTQTITLVLNRREKTKRDTLLLLGHFKDLCIIITDNNNINWFFGENIGCNLTTNEGGSGTAKADANRYTLTFIAEEPYPANTVTDAAVTAVI